MNEGVRVGGVLGVGGKEVGRLQEVWDFAAPFE